MMAFNSYIGSLIAPSINAGTLTTSDRSIDKVFEEAQYSGELLLTSKQLKNVPKIIEKYNLQDVTLIDLSKNRLTDLPSDVVVSPCLEELHASNNIIKFIHRDIFALKSLILLNLNCNLLTSLPREIGLLSHLEVLLVCKNKLICIPNDVSKLKNLMKLDLSHNRLTHLPEKMGSLSTLRHLNTSNNALTLLPASLSSCPLEHLDISCNYITHLPSSFSHSFTSLTYLSLHDNPLIFPPANVCSKGMVHVVNSLRREESKEERRRSSVLPHNNNNMNNNNNHHINNNKNNIISNYNNNNVVNNDGIENQKIAKIDDYTKHYNGNHTNAQQDISANIKPSSRAAPPIPSSSSSSAFSSIISTRKNSISDNAKDDPASYNSLGRRRDSRLSFNKSTINNVANINNGYVLSSRSQQADMSQASSNLDSCFTFKRTLMHLREDENVVIAMKNALEELLNVRLPHVANKGDFYSFNNNTANNNNFKQLHDKLKDGIMLCYLVNKLKVACISNIHIPSHSERCLSIAKSQRNMDSFLSACRSVQLSHCPTPLQLLDHRCLPIVARAVLSLIGVSQRNANHSHA